HSVYFIDRPEGDKECRTLIIPYNQMTDLPSSVPNKRNSLTISYSDPNGSQTNVFTLPTECLIASQMAIKKAKAAKSYLTKLKTKCASCGYISEDYTDNAPLGEHCLCGQLYERTIIK
ncbi:MAG: hypothetical protein K0R55_3687, partial [Sporomusa sp.]|nr:hypothetical protein [Sporomusa sp.]